MTSNFRLSEAFINEAEQCRFQGHLVQTQDLFFPMPDQWGLRADPYLWAALAAHMSGDLEYLTDFRAGFMDAFEELTGRRFNEAPGAFKTERFAYGGMSSGVVSMDWWRSTGLPLLLSRFEATKATVADRQ